MTIEPLNYRLTVCKIPSLREAEAAEEGFFCLARTEEEISLVCETDRAPRQTAAREDGWKCFRVQGTLDFSLTGILAGLSAVLAEQNIGIFAVSTYNTDYILVKEAHFDQSLRALAEAGYHIAAHSPGRA